MTGSDPGMTADEIRLGLEKAVERGSLLKVQRGVKGYFLLNSPRGRAARLGAERPG